jgi:hypothetical protein
MGWRAKNGRYVALFGLFYWAALAIEVFQPWFAAEYPPGYFGLIAFMSLCAVAILNAIHKRNDT